MPFSLSESKLDSQIESQTVDIVRQSEKVENSNIQRESKSDCQLDSKTVTKKFMLSERKSDSLPSKVVS